MDWVHCNTCFVQPGNGSKKFFLTSCGHVFCQDCIQGRNLRLRLQYYESPDCLFQFNTLDISQPFFFLASTSQKCVVCRSSCTVIPLTSNVSSIYRPIEFVQRM